mmetsp:Transcript_41300/g.81471  ORF Transcript_41300/g.81471 Transcript_41300/m.81471 type:complete len:89 (+) Transcript_41300:498-764(+)
MQVTLRCRSRPYDASQTPLSSAIHPQTSIQSSSDRDMVQVSLRPKSSSKDQQESKQSGSGQASRRELQQAVWKTENVLLADRPNDKTD